MNSINTYMTRERYIIIISAASIIAAVFIYSVMFAPLVKKLSAARSRCQALEAQALDLRTKLEGTTEISERKFLISEKDIPALIDEVTKRGAAMGVNFVSIKPGEVRPGQDPEYRVLPVEMEIEALNEKFMLFMGMLDEMQRGVVRIKSFEIMRNKEDAAKFNARMVVDLYLFGEESGK